MSRAPGWPVTVAPFRAWRGSPAFRRSGRTLLTQTSPDRQGGSTSSTAGSRARTSEAWLRHAEGVGARGGQRERASASDRRPPDQIEEREGFEPSVRCRTHDFQSCPFGHSGISPVFQKLCGGSCDLPRWARARDLVRTRRDTGTVRRVAGGESGSRTHVGLAPKPDFESGAFGHSAISPETPRSREGRCVYHRKAPPSTGSPSTWPGRD